jgi:hypothetical protein
MIDIAPSCTPVILEASPIEMGCGLMNPGAADNIAHTSFTSLPDGLIDSVREVAERRGFDTLRQAYDEAITELCDDIEAGLVIDRWPNTAPGRSVVKETVRMTDTVADRMRAVAPQQGAKLVSFFIIALSRWLGRHGVEFKV